MKKIILGLVVLTTLISCHRFEFEGKGDIVSRELDLPSLERFALEGSFDVFVTQGPEQTIVAEGESNIIDRLKTSVTNGRWDISLQHGSYTDFNLTIFITVPDIREMILDGSGDIFIEDFALPNLQLRSRGSGDFVAGQPLLISNKLALIAEGSGDIGLSSVESSNLSVDIEGSGNVVMSGTTSDASYYVDGSGDVKGFDLQTTTCSAVARASGDIELTATAELDVQIDASGNVLYKGDPNISQKITGSGKLINMN